MNNGVISHFCKRYDEHGINSNMGSLCFNKWYYRGLELFRKDEKVEGGNYNDELCRGGPLYRGLRGDEWASTGPCFPSRSEFTTARNIRDGITKKLLSTFKIVQLASIAIQHRNERRVAYLNIPQYVLVVESTARCAVLVIYSGR